MHAMSACLHVVQTQYFELWAYSVFTVSFRKRIKKEKPAKKPQSIILAEVFLI